MLILVQTEMEVFEIYTFYMKLNKYCTIGFSDFFWVFFFLRFYKEGRCYRNDMNVVEGIDWCWKLPSDRHGEAMKGGSKSCQEVPKSIEVCWEKPKRYGKIRNLPIGFVKAGFGTFSYFWYFLVPLDNAQ